MKLSEIEADQIVLTRGGKRARRGQYNVDSRAWNAGTHGYIGKIVGVGHFRFKRDSECGLMVVEEYGHATKCVHVLVAKEACGTLVGIAFRDVKVKKIDWEKDAVSVLLSARTMRSWDFALHIEEENIELVKLNKARQDRVKAVNKEIHEVLVEAVKKLTVPKGTTVIRQSSGSEIIIQATSRIHINKLPKRTQTQLEKLHKEAFDLNQCVRDSLYR